MDFKHNLWCPFKLTNPCSFFTVDVFHIIYSFFKASIFQGFITEIKTNSNQKVSATMVEKTLSLQTDIPHEKYKAETDFLIECLG